MRCRDALKGRDGSDFQMDCVNGRARLRLSRQIRRSKLSHRHQIAKAEFAQAARPAERT